LAPGPWQGGFRGLKKESSEIKYSWLREENKPKATNNRNSGGNQRIEREEPKTKGHPGSARILEALSAQKRKKFLSRTPSKNCPVEKKT